MQLRAPAKINLSFKILSRREDGFHEIETLMAPVSLYDELTLTTVGNSGTFELVCDDSSLPGVEGNLVARAARIFLEATAIRIGLRIELRKRIPHGAGLGGGSSDAAEVLLGLNQLLDAKLSVDELARIGAEIGSDVPFFIYKSAAVCRGRGELVAPTRLPEKLSLLLVKPAFGVPTSWAYGRWKDSQQLPNVSYERQTFRNQLFINDLERPVFEKYLFLARLKTWLLAQAEVGAALLSGSGSTVLAVLKTPDTAVPLGARAKAELDPELWTCACHTVSG